MDWQPIETAPRDGTHFLAAWGSGAVSIVWWIGDGYNSFGNGSSDRCGTPHQFGPSWFTHWMPLPAPPSV